MEDVRTRYSYRKYPFLTNRSSSTKPSRTRSKIMVTPTLFYEINLSWIVHYLSNKNMSSSRNNDTDVDPLMKFMCVKMVVFFCYWQTCLLSLIGTLGKFVPLSQKLWLNPPCLDIQRNGNEVNFSHISLSPFSNNSKNNEFAPQAGSSLRTTGRSSTSNSESLPS